MAHLSYKEFKDKFGNLGVTEWVRYNWIGWNQAKTAYYLRKHLADIAEIDFDDTDVVDLETLDWTYGRIAGIDDIFGSSDLIGSIRPPDESNETIPAIAVNYNVVSYEEALNNSNMVFYFYGATNGNIRCKTNGTQDLKPSGLLAYEKA